MKKLNILASLTLIAVGLTGCLDTQSDSAPPSSLSSQDTAKYHYVYESLSAPAVADILPPVSGCVRDSGAQVPLNFCAEAKLAGRLENEMVVCKGQKDPQAGGCADFVCSSPGILNSAGQAVFKSLWGSNGIPLSDAAFNAAKSSSPLSANSDPSAVGFDLSVSGCQERYSVDADGKLSLKSFYVPAPYIQPASLFKSTSELSKLDMCANGAVDSLGHSRQAGRYDVYVLTKVVGGINEGKTAQVAFCGFGQNNQMPTPANGYDPATTNLSFTSSTVLIGTAFSNAVLGSTNRAVTLGYFISSSSHVQSSIVANDAVSIPYFMANTTANSNTAQLNPMILPEFTVENGDKYTPQNPGQAFTGATIPDQLKATILLIAR